MTRDALHVARGLPHPYKKKGGRAALFPDKLQFPG